MLSTYEYFSRSLTAYRTYITPVALSDVTSRRSNVYRLFTQSLSVSDVMGKKSTVYRHFLSSLSLLDAVSGYYHFVLSDVLTPTGVLSRTGSMHRSFADAFGVIDYYSRVISHVREFVDATTLTDYSKRVASHVRELCDISSLSEYFARVVSSFREFEDVTTLSEYYTRLANYIRKLEDTSTLVEYFMRSVNLTREFRDATILSEYFIRRASTFREFEDTVALSEYFMRLVNYMREFSEVTNIEEFLSFYLTLVLMDYVLVADYLAKVLSSVLSDSMTLVELSRLLVSPRFFTESLELYETVSKLLTISRILTEVIPLYHVFKYYHVYREYFFEIVSLSDFILRSKIYSVVLSDPIALTADLLKSVNYHRGFIDTLTFYSMSEFLRSKILREVLSLLDIRTYIVGLVLPEPLALEDILQLTIIKTLFDSFSIVSGLSRRISCVRVITEFISTLDLISKYPMISLSELVGISAIIASVTETSVMKVITELINIFKVSSIYDTDIVKVLSDLVNINDGNRDSEETE